MPYYALLGRPCHLGADMPAHVVVPEGTVLHRMTADEVLIGPEVTPVRDQMEHTWSHGGAVVLPNLALAAVLEGWDERDLQFDGYELVLPGTGRHGDPVHLCTDTEGACPADVEQVRAGREHTCDGILGLYRAETLEWMECPTVTVVTHATLRHLPLLLSAEAVLGKACATAPRSGCPSRPRSRCSPSPGRTWHPARAGSGPRSSG
ncbi:hypothetical protein ACFQ78_35655 [Streptomyces sp. NPDC056519]|uniref:hypothetical protein n=1 Tax=Streptomyces sp. NPDC056519 TaxID=3345849 RepID=UPI00369DD0AA